MGIYFGAMSDPIKKQIGFDSVDVKHIQKDADAVTRLVIRGIITDSQANQARTKLAKRIGEIMRKKLGA